MNNNLKDILANSNKDFDNQQLMDYLSQQLAAKESHDIEIKMAADDFTNDAIEGLQEIKKKKDLPLYVNQINKDFQEQLNKGKKRKAKRTIKHQGYTYFAVLLIILLLIICINLLRKNYQQNHPVKKTVIACNTPVILNQEL